MSGLTHIDPRLVGSQLCESMVWRELADALLCHIWEVVVGGGGALQPEESKVKKKKKNQTAWPAPGKAMEWSF